jgi:hypothetical protein
MIFCLERVFLDISSIKAVSFVGFKFWVLVVDDCTDYCWSVFLKLKSDVSSKMLQLFNALSSINGKYKVVKVRMDNAGENKALQQIGFDHKFGITFEYTAPNSPQYNGQVERKFDTLYA